MLPRAALVTLVFSVSFACSSGTLHDREGGADAVSRSGDVREAVPVARGPASIFRLGDAVVISRGGTLERVTPQGDVEPLTVEGMPQPERVMSRGGREVTSGATTALLGESLRTFWVGWSTYSVFGSTTILGVAGGKARTTRDRPPEEHEGPVGEMRSADGRGHLFVITNLVSGEGDSWGALPSPLPKDRAEAVAKTTVVGTGGVASELGDGTIVHVDHERATCISRGTRTVTPLAKAWGALPWRDSIAVLGCRDVAILTAPGELWRERDGVATRIHAPLTAEHLRVSDDGTLWVTGNRHEAYVSDRGAWRTVRWAGPPDMHDDVVAITREALFVHRSGAAEDEAILRVPL